MDWLDLLAVQGTLKSLQYHSSKASIPWHSAFFIVQLSHPYTTIGKTIVLTRHTIVTKYCLCFLVCYVSHSFSPKEQVILEPKKIKSLIVSIVSHLFAMKWWDQRPWSWFSECWVLSQLFPSPLSFSSRSSSSSSLSARRVALSTFLRLLIFWYQS